MKSTANVEIKAMLKEHDIFYWEIAGTLGVHESTVVRWLRTELSDEQKLKITQAAYMVIKSREEV